MTISLFILFPLETGLLVIGFTFLYTLIFISLKGRLRSAGGNVSNLYRERISILSDITQGMVDTRSLKLEEHFNIKFHLSSSKLTLNSGTVQFLSQVPKSVIESVLFVLILVFVYISEGDPKAFGVLATFGLASMKLLPVGQRIYHSIAQIAANISALREVRAFQDQMTKFQKNSVPVSASKLKNGDCIRINQLTLRYPGAKEVLGPFNFEMRIQSQVVFYGASGIGKSSIFSMLVGDIYPKEGQFFLNDVRVEHSELVNLFCNTMLIAQSSYVFRASLIENITGFDRNVDYDRYQLALNNACVPSELVERLAEAELGENALTLSGGQRQRVLIARGLYNICDTYFFDEITSALDKATALEVIANISHDKFNSICFFIAHDISLWADTDAECIEIVV
jgi:ABC-type transport system involved in cytochrome bd biosynthesis fused ATPase/permease subunit